jgi:hypothetical protein
MPCCRRALALWAFMGAYMQRKEEARMAGVKQRLKQATRLKKMGGFMGDDGTIQFKAQRDAFGQEVEISEEQLERIRVRARPLCCFSEPIPRRTYRGTHASNVHTIHLATGFSRVCQTET